MKQAQIVKERKELKSQEPRSGLEGGGGPGEEQQERDFAEWKRTTFQQFKSQNADKSRVKMDIQT